MGKASRLSNREGGRILKNFAFGNLELMQTDIENRMKIHNRAQNRKLAKSPVSKFKINSIFLRNHDV